MIKHRKTYISLFLLPLLISCSHSTTPPSEEPPVDDKPGEGEVIPEPPQEEEEDIFDQGYTSLRVDGENYYELCEGLYINKQPGLYKFDFNLKFAYNEDKGELYYNYNGEKPMKNVLCYLSPFDPIEIYENVPEGNGEIPLTTAVDEKLDSYNDRCVSYNYINNVQNPMTYEFFHNACVVNITFVYKEKTTTNMALSYLVDGENEYTLPMIFLSMPYRNWFGSPYYFYNNIKEEVDQRVWLEYYDPVSKDYWQRNSKIKLGGGWSKGYPQRTLNLNFKKDENGDKNEKVNEPIFGDRYMCGDTSKKLSKHIRFRLHNGGNCFEENSGFNDAIMQRAMFGTNAASTAYRPCLVYLNGEYWGLMSLREHYSDYYIKQNYGVDDDNVTMFEVKGDIIFDDGDENGMMYINQLKTMINDSRFNSGNQTLIDEAYQELSEMIDIDSFIDALLAEYYCCNWDYVGNFNNLKMWRAMNTSSKPYEDGKWRFCLHDLDFAFTEKTNFLDKNVSHSYNNWGLVKDCMLSPIFRSKLVARAEELAASNLSIRNLSNVTSDMYDEVKPYKKDFGLRWGQPKTFYNSWLNYYSYLLNYYKSRTDSFVDELKTTLNNQYGGY